MVKQMNFWAVFVTPWTKRNRILLALYILVILCLLLAGFYIKTGWISPKAIWFFLAPLGFYLIYFIIGRKVEILRKKLPSAPLLQTDCIIVNNMVEMPGIAHLDEKKLILKPIIGSQIYVSFADLENVKQRRWYNGSGYLGQTIFFEIPTSKQWRLGFGVAQAKPWRSILHSRCKDK